MALGSNQPLTEMSTKCISCRVKAADAWGLQPFHFHALIVLKSKGSKLLEPSEPFQASAGIALPFTFTYIVLLTHCGRVTQICVFNTVNLGTSASSP